LEAQILISATKALHWKNEIPSNRQISKNKLRSTAGLFESLAVNRVGNLPISLIHKNAKIKNRWLQILNF